MAAERNHTSSGIYEIKIQGRLDTRWSEWFYGMTITPEEGRRTTILYGPLPDQTVLHSVLDRIRDMNLHLISVNQIVTDEQRKSADQDKGVTQ
jgi:hypothetical protein